MSCVVTHNQPMGEPYEKPSSDPFMDTSREDCQDTQDCPRGGLGGTFEMTCRGTRLVKKIPVYQKYHVCYECVGIDGCVFNFCDTEEKQIGTNTYEVEPCDALENCADCPEYPHRPGDGGFPGSESDDPWEVN